MLASLQITNIAIIEKIEITLSRGLNILSGETGAGKSIIIDSLNFVLGERADKSLIRFGEDSASVQAVFEDYINGSVAAYLEDTGIEAEEVLILYRKMTAEGKNECRINGRQVTLSVLKGLTELLADIHGQHEHQALLKPSVHMGFLDLYGKEITAAAKRAYYDKYCEHRKVLKELSEFGDEEERLRRMDVLKYQIEEIRKACVKEGEQENLIAERNRLRNFEKIKTALETAAAAIDGMGGNSAAGLLNSARHALTSAVTYDERLAELEERLDSAKIEVQDIAETLGDLLYSLGASGNLEAVENRLEKIRNLFKKYGGDYPSLTEYAETAEEEYDKLAGAADRVAELTVKAEKTLRELQKCAENLTENRKKTAKELEIAVKKELADLGMGGAMFKTEITPSADYTPSGADNAEFTVSFNKGTPLKPLAKVISGGEMSRFMLAFKNISADGDGIATMVFDEIDTGISGNIAQVVAQKLVNISRDRQVIAVTHLPQLASMADKHFLIDKSEKDGKTLTSLLPLDRDGREKEIARLIGGDGYSGHALPHAREMLTYADEYKNSIAKPR